MRAAALCVLLAWTLSGQAISGDAVTRLRSTLQRINAEVHEPSSIVIAVQTNDATLAALAGLRDLDLILRQLIKGGEIAVLSYGDQVRTVQSFTSDSAKAVLAIAGLRVGGASPRALDAVNEAVSALETQKGRRVLLLIGEIKDRASGADLRDTMIRAQRSNVLIYGLAL